MEITNDLLPAISDVEMSELKEVVGFFDGLRPIERIGVTQWADKYRRLVSISAAEPGRYRTDRTPYLRAIMDALTASSPYRQVVVMKAAQIGFTEALCNFIGYTMHINPSPIIMVQPTDMMVSRLSKTRIDPLIEACPELRERVSAPKSRDGNNTINMKSFPGGVLFMTGANSSAGLRSTAAGNLCLDELDEYPEDLNDQGSPIGLAIARARTYTNKCKILMGSTPTISGTSAIEKEFLETDQNYYHVPCPHCGGMQRLVWENLTWQDGKPETAQYACVHCGALIDEWNKTQMLLAGEWIPECPERQSDKVIGFHINSLYSPYGWYSWENAVRDFLASKDNPHKHKVFVNTVLGEAWAEQGDAPEYKNLYNRREAYHVNTIPDDVCFLTAGVDVQRDRLEIEIVGWCADKRSYSIDYRVLNGETAYKKVWDELAKLLDERWERPNHLEIPIRLMCVDSGYNTSHVYDFCRRFTPDRVIPIKGQDSLGMAISMPKQVDVTRSGKKIGKVKVWNVGVSFLKSELYSWLRLEKDDDIPPSCYCHFPQYDEHYFKGLTAEKQVRRIVRGFARYEWKKEFERNEPLDCRIYNRAAAAVLGIDRLTPEKLQALGGKQVKPVRQPDAETVSTPASANPFSRGGGGGGNPFIRR